MGLGKGPEINSTSAEASETQHQNWDQGFTLSSTGITAFAKTLGGAVMLTPPLYDLMQVFGQYQLGHPSFSGALRAMGADVVEYGKLVLAPEAREY